MKNLRSSSIVFGLAMALLACTENKIKVSEGRFATAEPDKPLRIESEIRQTLVKLSHEIDHSDSITLSESGKKLLNSGMEILPYLKNTFLDSTRTKVYSAINKRTLTLGELTILVADKIKPIPVFYVLGIQQCTPPFEDVESFFWKIQDKPDKFIENYTNWINEELTLKTQAKTP